MKKMTAKTTTRISSESTEIMGLLPWCRPWRLSGARVRGDLARGRRGGAGRRRRARARGRGGRAHAESRQGRHQGRSPMISVDSLLILVVVFAVIFFIGSFAKILREYERAVIFRLGRSTRAIL